MPRYTILLHDFPQLHWDLLLEPEENADKIQLAQTWRILAEPDSQPKIPAEKIPDHRLMYLDYTGPVSGNRGSVQQWDSGIYKILEVSNTVFMMQLTGKKLHDNYQFLQQNSHELVWMKVPSA